MSLFIQLFDTIREQTMISAEKQVQTFFKVLTRLCEKSFEVIQEVFKLRASIAVNMLHKVEMWMHIMLLQLKVAL